MRLPRLVLGTVLALLAANLSALELTVRAWELNGWPVAECRIDGIDIGEITRSMDAGGTARITWQFRLGQAETTLVRLAHRDSLGEGYIIYSESGEDLQGPYSNKTVVEKLSVLPVSSLDGLGLWSENEWLESRVFVDYNLNIAPLSVADVFSSQRDQTAWHRVSHPRRGGE